jgi:hypothetical protein
MRGSVRGMAIRARNIIAPMLAAAEVVVFILAGVAIETDF